MNRRNTFMTMSFSVAAAAIVFATANFAQDPVRVLPREVVSQPGAAAKDLTADDVARLERQVAAAPEDMWARRVLLQYYYETGSRTQRLPHVYWVVEHHPEDEAVARGLCDLPPDTNLATRSDYEYGRSLWLSQVAKNPSNPAIRQNAARYFEPYDLALAVENLEAAVASSPSENPMARFQLARVYSRILRASAGPPSDPGERLYTADPAFLSRLKSNLDTTNDWRLLMMVAGTSQDRAFSDKLIARAKSLNPDAYGNAGVIGGIIGSVPSGAPLPAAPAGSIRVGGNVQAAKLIRKTPPEYPALAKQARIQGTVRFNVVIAKDGTIQNLMLVSGHPLLVPPAQEAVRQWVYQPTLLNGNPVQVITTVDVNFSLADTQSGTTQPPAQ